MRTYVGVHGHAQLWSRAQACVDEGTGMRGCAWACTDVRGHAQMCMGMRGCVWACADVRGHALPWKDRGKREVSDE